MINFFIDLVIKNKNKSNENEIENNEIIQNKTSEDKNKGVEYASDEDLKIINSMKRNGPLKKLSNEDVQTRAIIIMGEEPTSKISIHPEGSLNGKNVKNLSQLAKGLPGAPMMIGHRMDKEPWGRTFKANVELGGQGYTGKVVNERYFFLNDDEGKAIARKIDSGIWAEGSISYWFDYPCCNICHLPMGYYGDFKKRCSHRLGQKDEITGIVCMWYPHNITKVAETSYVFAGAYGKTRSMLAADSSDLKQCYSEGEIESGCKLEETLKKYGYDPDVNYDEYSLINGVYQKNYEQELEKLENNGNIPQINTNNGENDGNNKFTENNNTENNGSNNISTTNISSINIGNGIDPAKKEAGQCSETNGKESEKSEPLQVKIGNTNTSNQNDRGKEDNETNATNESNDNSCGDNGSNREPNRKSNEQNKIQPEKNGTEESTESNSNSNKDDDGINENQKTENTNLQGKSENFGGNGSESRNTNKPKSNDDSTRKSQEKKDGLKDDNFSSAETVNNNKNDGEKLGNENHTGSGNTIPHTLENISNLTDSEIYEIGEIYSDLKLDSNEKEECLRELLFDRPITLLQVMEICSKIKKAKKIKFCIGCNLEYENKKESICDSCGEELKEIYENGSKIFQPVGPIYPKKSETINNEYFKKEDFRENLPDGQYYIEPKYDGLWMEVHKKDEEVKMYSEDGSEHSKKFPNIINEIKMSKSKNFIIAGQMTMWNGRKRLSHKDAYEWIENEKDEYNDKDFKYKPFDIMHSNSGDITSLSLKERRSIMDATIQWGKQVHPTAFISVNHKKGDGKVVLAIENRKSREGTVIKDICSTYTKKDQSKIYEWKRNVELNCLVIEKKENENGEKIYTCSIGRGKNNLVLGETFSTKKETEVGNIIKVSVDFIRYDIESKKYSWYSPKVLNEKIDRKQPDPVSTIKKISEEKKSTENACKNIITLTEIIPKLKSIELEKTFYLVGGLVEKGLTSNDIDIVLNEELTEHEKNVIYSALGERLYERIDFIIDEKISSGPSIEINTDNAQKAGSWKYSKRFILQKHGWGKKEHYDLRFGAPKSKKSWGWTCFAKPSTVGSKINCLEKKYHDSKWMEIDNKSIKPGEDGNPTKNKNAYMIKEDEGTYKFIRRNPRFSEMILNGKNIKGRYLWREITVKVNEKENSKIEGDEVGVKSEKLWIMWKPKNQETNSPVNKIEFKYQNNCLIYWETDKIDENI